jgi:hypothetical protein
MRDEELERVNRCNILLPFSLTVRYEVRLPQPQKEPRSRNGAEYEMRKELNFELSEPLAIRCSSHHGMGVRRVDFTPLLTVVHAKMKLGNESRAGQDGRGGSVVK